VVPSLASFAVPCTGSTADRAFVSSIYMYFIVA
jgi:hypothetical protein